MPNDSLRAGGLIGLLPNAHVVLIFGIQDEWQKSNFSLIRGARTPRLSPPPTPETPSAVMRIDDVATTISAVRMDYPVPTIVGCTLQQPDQPAALSLSATIPKYLFGA